MKRGYMDPNLELLPDGLLAERRDALITKYEACGVDAAVIYGDVSVADELQYFANLGPYWGSATCVLGKDGSRSLVTGMTARVNFWVSMMSRVSRDDITAAGPNVDKALAKFLTERYPAGSVIGMVGEYFPAGMQAAVEAAGFRTVWMEDTAEGLMDLRDKGYHANLRKGIDLMMAAIPGALRGAAEDGRTMQEIAADVEYACRTAGAMDTLFLSGDNQLVFSKAPDRKADGPWTLYMQMQYLGDWIVLARNVDPALNESAFAARDKALAALRPGAATLVSESGGWETTLCRQVRSDHLCRTRAGDAALQSGQVIGVQARNRESGVMIWDMALITDQGAQLLTNI